MSSTESRARLGTRLLTSVLIGSTLMVAGCLPMFEDATHLSYEVPSESLETIDPISLREYASEDPITVEEASEDIYAEITESEATPAESIQLSLEQVRADALRYNLDLKVALVDPSIAATSIGEEEARFEATFTGSARYVDSETPSSTATGNFGSQIASGDVGLNIPLATGGSVSIDLPVSRANVNNAFSIINPSYNSDLRFSISQPLFRNAGVMNNLHGIRVARGTAQISSARTKLEAIRILANAERAYWIMYATREELLVRKQEYNLAVEQLRRAERRVNAGDLPEIEITRAESGAAERLGAVIIADTNVRRAQRNLKRILNRPDVPLDSPTRIELMTLPDPVFTELEPTQLVSYAVTNRMEMMELELQLAIDASRINFDRNQTLPLFVVDYSYNMTGLGTTWGRSFEQIEERSFPTHTIALRAEIPIGNEAAKSRLHRAVLTRLQRLSTRELRTLAIEQEVYDALDTLRESWQRILADRQASRLAGRTYAAEKRQFDLGLRTSTDVLDASTRLANAQSSEIRALTDYQISLVDLAFATGTLLGRNRIRWEPIDTDER